MSTTTKSADYAVGQKIVHWLMAVFIILDLFVAQKFGGVMADVDRFASRNDHSSLGTIVAALFIIRLYLRWKNGAPALPETMPDWQKWLAHVAHWALYILIGSLIITGILTAMNANSGIEPFGAFAYGNGVEGDFTLFRGFHEFTTKAIIALIGLHVVAALYHLIFVRDGVTSRMLMFWKSRKSV